MPHDFDSNADGTAVVDEPPALEKLAADLHARLLAEGRDEDAAIIDQLGWALESAETDAAVERMGGRLPEPGDRDGYITTYSGQKFCPADPDPTTIDILDIAQALSQLPHWGGHASHFFSVAQHSVLVSKLCPPELARWGLMHDAAEALR